MLTLYGYWRSSAAYRVRIALGLKQLQAQHISVHLVKEGGQQKTAAYKALNPQQLVPTLIDDGLSDDLDGEVTHSAMSSQINTSTNSPSNAPLVLTQSLAIIEYLEERYPQLPLLPQDIAKRAQVRAIAQLIACDIHPLNNLRVLQYLEHSLNQDSDARKLWYHTWVKQGFSALELMLSRSPSLCCVGDTPTLADICLVPQVYNALRFGIDMSEYPHITRVNDYCLTLPAFSQAAPELQADAVI